MAENEGITQQPDAQQPTDLQARFEALQKERDELFAKLQRVCADYANYQKRLPRQIEESLTCEQERMLKALLPICDHLEMAIQQATSQPTVESVLAGVKIVYDQLQALLRSYDVEPIAAVDRSFDPRLHEAMMTRCDPTKADRLVLQECQKGYVRGERVLRPSKVVVNALQVEQGTSSGDVSSQKDQPDDRKE